jgi:hypothetical protein
MEPEIRNKVNDVIITTPLEVLTIKTEMVVPLIKENIIIPAECY